MADQLTDEKQVDWTLLSNTLAKEGAWPTRIIAPPTTAKYAMDVRSALYNATTTLFDCEVEMQPPPLPPGASQRTKARHRSLMLNAKLRRALLAAPLGSGGMGLTNLSTHVTANFLAGQISFARHIRRAGHADTNDILAWQIEETDPMEVGVNYAPPRNRSLPKPNKQLTHGHSPQS